MRLVSLCLLVIVACAPEAPSSGQASAPLRAEPLSAATWLDLTPLVKVLPASKEEPGSGPTRVDVGADGRVVVTAPLDDALLVVAGPDKQVRRVAFQGAPRSVDARADGTLVVLDARTQSGVVIPPGDLPRQTLATPPERARWSALRYAPDGGLLIETIGARTRPYVDGGVASSPERGVPLALSGRQAFALRADDLTAEVRVAAWTHPTRDDGTPPEGEGVLTWRWRTTLHLGAVHVVGERRDGTLFVVTEELTSRQPLRVQRAAWTLSPDGDVERWVELPPPGDIPLAKEWALLPDGTLLLLRVDDAGARLLAWRKE
jgi:hypothetical protein